MPSLCTLTLDLDLEHRFVFHLCRGYIHPDEIEFEHFRYPAKPSANQYSPPISLVQEGDHVRPGLPDRFRRSFPECRQPYSLHQLAG